MNRIIASLTLCFAAFVFPPLTALAAPVTVPPTLSVGDQYRLVFVTSTQANALSPNIGFYDNFVTIAANSDPTLAALGTTWTAIGSTTAVAAEDHTSTNPVLSLSYPIYNLAGVPVAVSNAAFWSGVLTSPIDTTESGASPSFPYAWTGTTPAGLQDFPHILGSGALAASYGIDSVVNSGWVNITTAPTTTSFSVYAISGVLTVAGVPEPSTMVLACLAAAGLAMPLLRRRSKP
jgi:hypothetical protein